MFKGNYYRNKFIFTKDGLHTLIDMSITLDGTEYYKYCIDENKPNDYAIYLLSNPSAFFEDGEKTALSLFLAENGYTEKDFSNLFGRTKKIVNEIDKINIKHINEVANRNIAKTRIKRINNKTN